VKGKIYLIPVTLGGDDFMSVIPQGCLDITRRLRCFAVEDIRSARRYLRLIDRNFPIDSTEFHELSEHTGDREAESLIEPALRGTDIGIMSEAGLPGIADPGSKLIMAAHSKQVQVIPLPGPSSIILALISSGLDGQNFTFNGYLPVREGERAKKLEELERRAREGFSQIFMETPYRNQKLFEAVLSVCSEDLFLSVAADLTLPGEFIKTRKIAEWKKDRPDLHKRLSVFVLR